MAHPIVLYDGACGLCNQFVQFVLRRDTRAVFRFASLQSAVARAILARHSHNPDALDTVYVVLNDASTDSAPKNERVLARSDAALFVLRELGGIWHFAAAISRLIPRVLRDWGYRLIARNRYSVFGRYDGCPLPAAETRNRFLDT